MHWPTFILLLIIGSLSGCTAYQPVSKGYIAPAADWGVSYGGGSGAYSCESTVLWGKDIILTLTPCNYGDKNVFMVVPVPMPLGSIRGSRMPERFVVIVTFLASSGSFAVEPSSIEMTTPDGMKLKPSALMQVPYYASCEDVASDYGGGGSWHPLQGGSLPAQQLAKTEKSFLGLALAYETKTPTVSDEFVITMNQVSRAEG